MMSVPMRNRLNFHMFGMPQQTGNQETVFLLGTEEANSMA